METVFCAGAVVLNPDREVLVVTNKHHKRTFPKGTRERRAPDSQLEHPLATAWREMHEESGLSRDTVRLLGYLGCIVRPGHTFENGDEPSVIKRITMFHGICLDGAVELRPNATDILSAEWVSLDQLAAVLTWPQEYNFFEAHMAELGYPVAA